MQASKLSCLQYSPLWITWISEQTIWSWSSCPHFRVCCHQRCPWVFETTASDADVVEDLWELLALLGRWQWWRALHVGKYIRGPQESMSWWYHLDCDIRLLYWKLWNSSFSRRITGLSATEFSICTTVLQCEKKSTRGSSGTSQVSLVPFAKVTEHF